MPQRLLAVSIGLLFAMAPGVGARAQEGHGDTEKRLARIDRLEELLLLLAPDLEGLDVDVQNLELPDAHSRRLFAATVTVTDLARSRVSATSSTDTLVQFEHWPIDQTERRVRAQSLRLWHPFLEAVDFFTHAKFKIVRGRFLDPAERFYAADIVFTGAARRSSGGYSSVSAKLEVVWGRPTAAPAEEPTWRIRVWRTRSFALTRTAELLFTEVLDHALRDPADLERARRSLHEELVRSHLQDPSSPKPHEYFKFQSLNRHPGLSVVDIDGDGFDDLYVMARWGPNLLLRNRGDGTFEEIAADVGLDIRDHSSSALFADFDNDGDVDAFVGRTLARSVYLVNQEGTFVDRSETLVEPPLPFLVSSISAVDENGDGLLDVYFSTYGIDVELQEGFLPPAAAREIALRMRNGGHLFRDRAGPPNRLLRNLGDGRFALSPSSDALAGWRNTFQSTWSDFDSDGDMDVYLANDFAPNNLFRNDGLRGFVDVTAETDAADIGFGMGASFGDYDNDGLQDLYVTNMYSSAGRRITEQMGALGAELAPMARGNSLLRNDAGRYARVSGLESPALLVEKAGWSWGGQFVDVNNDGYLDIHALSGYYTAPEQPGRRPDL